MLLRELGDVLLASCEGVVGWVEKDSIDFKSIASNSSLSPVLASNSQTFDTESQIPRTVLISPSPPTSPASIAIPPRSASLKVDTPHEGRPISGPFELDSPISTPGLDKADETFFPDQSTKEEIVDMNMDTAESRQSVSSIASSAFGGIGGFMMGGADPKVSEATDNMENLSGEECISRRPLLQTALIICSQG